MTKTPETLTTFDATLWTVDLSLGITEPSVRVTRRDWTLTPKMAHMTTNAGHVRWEQRVNVEAEATSVEEALRREIASKQAEADRIKEKLDVVLSDLGLLSRAVVVGEEVHIRTEWTVDELFTPTHEGAVVNASEADEMSLGKTAIAQEAVVNEEPVADVKAARRRANAHAQIGGRRRGGKKVNGTPVVETEVMA